MHYLVCKENEHKEIKKQQAFSCSANEAIIIAACVHKQKNIVIG